MLKARHGWTDTSFNDLLLILGDTYPEGNKVPANTYRATKLIRLVAMKLKKFHVCPNHCILYQGKNEKLGRCLHYGASRYKRNAGCHWMQMMRMRKNSAKKSSAKQIPSHEDEEE